MIYKNLLCCVMLICGMLFSDELNATSCQKSCSKKCTATQSLAAFDCIPRTTEFLIVGLGTAGATLARYLSDPIDGAFVNNVVVLEAGQNYNQDPAVQNPSLFASSAVAANTTYSKTYSVLPGANASFGFNLLAYTEGRMWGGGSGHNGMQAVRGTPALYDDWATLSGEPFWAYNNLLPLMKFLEKYNQNGGGLDPLQRGTSGPLAITQDLYSLVSTNPFVVNIMSTFLPIVGDYNVPAGAIGISSLQQNNTNGQFTPGSIRSFSANSFLPTPADNPVNPIISADGFGLNGRKLQVLSDVTVSRIIFDGTTAVGVEYIVGQNPDEVFTMFATKEVILCAGATQNVAILQRSGIGPQTVLDPLGITPVVYNNNVGAHLSNHYGSFCIMTANGEGGVNLAPPLGMFFSDGAPYIPADGRRRIQALFGEGPFFFGDQSVLYGLLGAQIATDPFNPPTNSFAIINLVPQAEGTIVIPSIDPLTDAVVSCNIWGNVADFEPVLAGFKIVRDMATAAGETMIYPTPAMFATDAELETAIKALIFVAYHFAGTCRMASSAADGVVDGQLRVFGVNNLRIADCSIMPKINDGNTAIPAYYIAAVLAELLGNQTLPNILP